MLSNVILISYLILTALIGAYFTKKNNSISQFFVAKRGLGTLFVIPIVFSEIIGGNATVGISEGAFQIGISSVWIIWAMCIGCLLFALYTSKFFYIMSEKMGAMSVPEAFANLFDQKTRFVVAFILLFVYFIISGLQPLAAAAILSPMFGLNMNIIAWFVSFYFILTTILGGRKGLAWINAIHAVVMYVGLGITAIYAIKYVGGFPSLQKELPETFFMFDQPNLANILATIIGTGLSFLVAPTLVSACFSAKSLKAAKRGSILGGLLVIPFVLFPAIIGIVAKAVMPNIIAKNSLILMATAISPILTGVVSMAVIAAIFSTGPSLLLIASTIITRDIYIGIINNNSSNKRQLIVSRASILIFGVLSTYMGLQVTSIVSALSGAFQIRAIVGAVLLIALSWKRVNSKAVFWSMTIGGLVSAVWYFANNPFGISNLWPSLLFGLITLVIITLASKDKISSEHQRYNSIINSSTEIRMNK
jgi:SSS family solute:Na+ symporter